MENCYACDHVLTRENQSAEHIIPNAIGGRLKSKKLLCRKCNSEFGDKYEAEFVRQLSFFGGRLPIKRDRGTHKDFETLDQKTGKRITVNHKGKATLAETVRLEVPSAENNGRFRMLAPNQETADRIFRQIKKKHPNAKLEISPNQKKVEPEEIIIGGEFGGLAFFKTAQKCFLNLFIHKGGSRVFVEDEIRSVFYTDDDPKNWFLFDGAPRKVGMGLPHILAVIGKPEEKLLLGYGEFFGAAKVIALLSESYTGPAMKYIYSLDSVDGQEKECDVSIGLTKEQIVDIIHQKKIDHESISAHLGAAEEALQNNRYFSNMIEDVLSKTLFKPENVDKIITPEMITEMAMAMGEAVKPNIAAAAKKRHEEAEAKFKKLMQTEKVQMKKKGIDE